MRCNVGGIDRKLRIIVGLIIIATGLLYQSWWGVVGLVPLVTGFIRWCPAYGAIGVSTAGNSEKDKTTGE